MVLIIADVWVPEPSGPCPAAVDELCKILEFLSPYSAEAFSGFWEVGYAFTCLNEASDNCSSVVISVMFNFSVKR